MTTLEDLRDKHFSKTTRGYTDRARNMWLAGQQDGKFVIAVCEHPGILLCRSLHKVVATFEKEADRDFCIAAFQAVLTLSENKTK